MTRRVLILILLLFIPVLARAQGQQITVGPFSTAGLVYVCPVPSGGTPCPSPSSIFSNSALTAALANPFSMPTQTIVTFYAAGGQYTIEMPASGTQQVVGGGGNPTVGVPGPVFNVKDPKYGAIGDTKASRNCTTAASSKIVTSADNPWTAADVGKFMEIVQTATGADIFTPARKIASFQSAGQVTMDTTQDGGASPGGGNFCKWFTQDDTAAFVAATNAARAATSSFRPRDQTPTLGYPGTVTCPSGGYTVSGTIFIDNPATISLGIGLSGDRGGSHCVIYPTATFVGTVDSVCSGLKEGLIYTCQTDRTSIENIYVEGHDIIIPSTSIGAGQGFIMVRNCGVCTVRNNLVSDMSMASGNSAILYLNSTSGVVENNFIQNGGSNEAACLISNSSGLLFSLNTCSNHSQSIIISGSGTRGSVGGQLTLLNDEIDECGGFSGTAPCTQITSSVVNYVGGLAFGGVPELMSIDGTSQVYMTDYNLQQFGSTSANIPGVVIAAGGILSASQSTFASNGAATIFNGPSTATFVDVSGNTYLNCLSGTCTKITGTDFTTHGFSGGIFPTTGLTHTYPQPFLPALPTSGTALNIVAFTPSNSIMVRNFTITAGNTPTCATPPTFQISNGTQSFTQTFASAAQISGPFTPALTLFPGGTQVTLSITTAAYSCTTAPTNMNWSIEWQSAVSF